MSFLSSSHHSAVVHRITEKAELERTHNDHQVQLLAGATRVTLRLLCPRALSKHLLSPARLVL